MGAKKIESEDIGVLPVNLALILRADDLDQAKDFLVKLGKLLEDANGVALVHKDVSADHFWIQRSAGSATPAKRRD